MNHRKSLILLFLTYLLSMHAQSTQDFGVWTNLGVEKKFGRWELSSEAELRTMNNTSEINRISWSLGGQYSLLKRIKVGAGYEFIYFNDTKYSDYQPRNRFILFTQGAQKWGNFTFSLRERFQVTTKDESDRIKSSGNIVTYKINPEWTWRNRLKVDYNIPHSHITPAVSVESFYQLNNPDGNQFDNLRYTFSLDYKLTKKHTFELYWLVNDEINVSSPERQFVLGAGYTYSF